MTFQKLFSILASFAFFLFLAPQFLEAASEEIPQVKAEKKLYTVIEFESTFMNKRKEDILIALGEPDSKNKTQNKEVWKYNQIVKDVGKLWDQNIMFDFGRVNYIWSDQPSLR